MTIKTSPSFKLILDIRDDIINRRVVNTEEVLEMIDDFIENDCAKIEVDTEDVEYI